MAARGGAGVDIDLDLVPLREASLTPYEIMLSESQERMVFVTQRGQEQTVASILSRWGLQARAIGRVTDDGRARLTFRGQTVADMPVEPLVDGAPVYDRPAAPPADLARRQDDVEPEAPDDPLGTLKRLLGTPEIGDKAWIFRQYDSTVRSNTIVGPGADAAVLRLKGTPSALALTSDTNPSYCWLDPRMGGRQAVAEAVREPGYGGRRAGGYDELPELRLAGEPRDRVAASGVHLRDGRCVPGVRRAGDLRQRLPLQRDRGRSGPADAHGGNGRV